MSLQLFMDVHVPIAITRQLRNRGIDVLRAQEDGSAEWDDLELLRRATSLGRVMFTMDNDFWRETTLLYQSGENFAGVIIADMHRVTIGECVLDLELLAKAHEPGEMRNRVEHIPI
jgi:predicted nuclease of predicted toxin-antitoxin system